MLKTFAMAALSLTGALMMATPASADCPQRCDNNYNNHTRGRGALIDVDANIGGRGRSGGLLNVDANVGGRNGLVDADVNVLSNNRGHGRGNGGSLVDLDVNVGGRGGLLNVDANVLNNNRNRGGSLIDLDANVGGRRGLVDVDANVLSNNHGHGRGGSAISLNADVLQGGVGH